MKEFEVKRLIISMVISSANDIYSVLSRLFRNNDEVFSAMFPRMHNILKIYYMMKRKRELFIYIVKKKGLIRKNTNDENLLEAN